MTDDKTAITEFKKVVNMTPKKLAAWLQTAESKKVGYKDGGVGVSVGHESGRKIIAILEKKQADYTDADLAHMHKVVGYIHRHLAQKPDGDVTHTTGATAL